MRSARLPGPRTNEILHRTAEAIDAPGRNDVKLPPSDRFEHRVKARPFLPAFSAATSLVLKRRRYFPSMAGRRSLEFTTLILNRLTSCRHAKVKGRTQGLLQ
jgi:hypothetical protein